MKRDEKTAGNAVKKAAKGVYIVVAIAVTLFAVVMFATVTFVGVRLWQWLAPLFANT